MKKYLVILSLFAAVMCLYLSIQKDKYHPRQVKAIPEKNAQIATMLDLNRHIRHQPRPKERFPFPIPIGQTGPIKPLYAGAKQYPFYCMSLDSGLGQPLVDNQQGWGVPVYDDETNIGQQAHIIGYSKDCQIVSRTQYLTLIGDKWHKLKPNKAHDQQLIVRVEQGSINRFIYTLVIPVSQQDIGSNKSQRWNQRLIYQFGGGSGIGFRQGRINLQKLLNRRLQQLEKGYAVITSTGNKTSYTYNMLLAEDTARRVKQQFIGRYGEPLYTVGIGGSGGGLAQYLIGQNSTGILDAALPLYSYPDMISQTLYALDCDLFNAYYSFKSDKPDYWQHWPNRIYVEGMNAINGETHASAWLEPVNQLLMGRWPVSAKGNSECINGWFGLSTFVHNPSQGFLREFFADDIVANTQWNYWEDMVNLYGRDQQGFANSAWSNTGVQYGLKALQQQQLSPEQFIHLNWHIGSWKSMENMQAETLWAPKGKRSAVWLSLWSQHNITQATESAPAPRQAPNSEAIVKAYRSGQIFIGEIDIPIIDIRHYLEHKLDMHHMSASFSSRLRIQQAKGHHNHQIIWVSDENYTPLTEAFSYIDQWMMNIKANPEKASWQVKPVNLQDACFNQEGEIIYQGENAWHGQWAQQPPGACSQEFRLFSNSRIQAGGPWSGNIFSCKLISIKQAIAEKMYAMTDMSPYQEKLEQLFPDGVCQFDAGDQGKPDKL